MPGSTRQASGRHVHPPGRWAPIAAVVVGGIVFLSVLTGPSGLEPEDEVVETPSITAQSTTTVPAPGSSRELWVPPAGTWVGGFAFGPRRPDTLYGPSMAAGLLEIGPDTVVVDSLPDGRLVGVDSNSQQVVLIGAGESGPTLEITPLPWPGPLSTPPLVSPDGTLLAMIDETGVPYVWRLADASDPQIVPALQLVSPRDSRSTAVGAILSLAWSPDSTVLALNAFQGGYYVWDLSTNQVSRNPMPGRAIAISDSQVAAWDSNGLELRDHTGRVLRRWDDLFPSEPVRTLPSLREGAFDPQHRYLVVRGQDAPDGDAQEGLTVLSVIGTARQLLTTDPAQGFSWSGDGNGLYWLNGDGLQVWSAVPDRAPATLVGRGNEDVLYRLRVYDPAISPIPHPELTTASLVERRAESLFIRTLGGMDLLDVEEGVTTIIPAGIPGHFLSVATGDAGQSVLLTDPTRPASAQPLGSLTTFQLPEASRFTRAIALSPGSGEDMTPLELEATRWYLETDTGSILFGPDSGLFTTAAQGSSLSILGGTAFHVTPDGSTIQTVSAGSGINIVLTAADLEAERILAVGVVRRALFVLVATADGGAQIWQVPGDSPLLTTPLLPPAPSATSDAWVVHRSPGPVTGGAILAEPDAGPTSELFAARIDGPDGSVAIAMATPLALESVCGASAGGACVVATLPGTPIGFSPDGNWLLVGDGDGFGALSTVGRGYVRLSDVVPDDIVWVGVVP